MFSQWGRWGKTSVQTSSNRFLTEGAVKTDAAAYSNIPILEILSKMPISLLTRMVAFNVMRTLQAGQSHAFF